MITDGWVFVTLSIVSAVVYAIMFGYIMKTWRRWLWDIERSPDCYKLVCNDAGIKSAYVKGIGMAIISIFVMIAAFIAMSYPPFRSLRTTTSAPFIILMVICVLISGPVYTIRLLLSHVKITDAGIGLDAFGKWWLPMGVKKFGWADISSVIIEPDDNTASGIKWVIVKGYYRGQSTSFVIPGYLQDIERIVDIIEKRVPDVVVKE